MTQVQHSHQTQTESESGWHQNAAMQKCKHLQFLALRFGRRDLEDSDSVLRLFSQNL